MPRFPMILVIGSQDISTRLRCCGSILSLVVAMSVAPRVAPARVVAARQLGLVVAPLRLLVGTLVGDAAHCADEQSIGALDQSSGERCTGRHVHERHELVRE